MKSLFLIIANLVVSYTAFACQPTASDTTMKEKFGSLPDGREAYLYTLRNSSGMMVKITDYGATVVSIYVPDQLGKFSDVALGYDNLKGYIHGKAYFGATIGRYANRIAKGEFTLAGKAFQLPINNGENTLHGGTTGFSMLPWSARQSMTSNGPALRLSLVNKDMDQGFPGTVTVSVTYTLTEDNELRIEYAGTTDKQTVINLTNHTYFNLSGDPTKTIVEEGLMINSSKYTPVNDNQIPTGELANVVNTPFDFQKPTVIGSRINEDKQQLKIGRGYDLNWVLNDYDKKVRKAAELYDPSSGRLLTVLTDQPGLQFYSGNSLNGTEVGKKGVHYEFRTGLALETEFFPDSPNEPSFPSTTLNPGQTYHQTTIYKFSIRK